MLLMSCLIFILNSMQGVKNCDPEFGHANSYLQGH